MKKFKSLIYVLALALIFVGAASVTKASAASENEQEDTQAVKIVEADVTPLYEEEAFTVECSKQVYYQIVKQKSNNSGLKPANWIKAAKGEEEEGKAVYWIDFSGTANSKDAFFALTTDSTQGNADCVAEVNAVVKSVKATLDYKVEDVKNGLADVISVLDVKGVEGGDTTKEGIAASDSTEAGKILKEKSGAKVFALAWKRGANGYWQGAEWFDTLEWDMLKASNGTLYISIIGKYVAGEEEVADTVAFRMSKEAKVKIPKSAKAPTVKVDYVKGTLALKNGMQIRLAEGVLEGNPWMDVIAYDKTAQDKGIFARADDGLKTNKKASKVAVADFAEAINVYLTEAEEEGEEETDDFGAGAELTLELRTAATEKKFPSMTGIMKLVLPADAPEVDEAANGEKAGDADEKNIADLVYAKADKASNTTAAYTVKFSDLFTKPNDKQYTDYEYVVVADPADGVNLEKQKWTKLTGESVDWAKNIGKKFTYYKAGSTEKATVQYENIKAIYIRLAAVKGDKEKTGVFASEYATIYVNPVAEYTLTNDAESAVKVTFKVDGKDVTKAKVGDKVTFVYKTAEGKELVEMTCTAGGTAVKPSLGESDTYSFDMPEGHVVLKITEKAKEEAKEEET